MTDYSATTSGLSTDVLTTISYLTHSREPLVNRVRNFFLSKFSLSQIADFFGADQVLVEELLYLGRANPSTKASKPISYDNLIIFAHKMAGQGLITPRDQEEFSCLLDDIKKIQEMNHALVSHQKPAVDKKKIGLVMGDIFCSIGVSGARLEAFVAILDHAPAFSQSLAKPPLRIEETLAITHSLFSAIDINTGNLKALSVALNKAKEEMAEVTIENYRPFLELADNLKELKNRLNQQQYDGIPPILADVSRSLVAVEGGLRGFDAHLQESLGNPAKILTDEVVRLLDASQTIGEGALESLVGKLGQVEAVLISPNCHTAGSFFYPPTPFMTQAVSDAIIKELLVGKETVTSLAGALLTNSPPYKEKLEVLASSLEKIADSELVTEIARTRPRDLGHIFDGTFKTTRGFGELRTALQILTGRHNGILDQYDLLTHQASALVMGIESPRATPSVFAALPKR